MVPGGWCVCVLGIFYALAVGYDHAVALDDHGVVWSWGSRGQSPTPDTTLHRTSTYTKTIPDGGSVEFIRISGVGQLGSTESARGPGLENAPDVDPAIADALGVCKVVAAGGLFTVCWPKEGVLASRGNVCADEHLPSSRISTKLLVAASSPQ